jgi:hypothetical protein
MVALFDVVLVFRRIRLELLFGGEEGDVRHLAEL